jgi:uncharacterized surface protein with fasciclin (FAS1) repeats
MTQRLLRLPSLLVVLAVLGLAAAQDRPATIADAIRAEPELAELASLLEESGLLEDLAGPMRFTFFAPSDRALGRLDPATHELLLRDRGALDLIVRHHVVMGASPLSALRRLDALTTLEGTHLKVTDMAGTVRVGGTRVAGDGVVTGNGVLYVVHRVLLPDAATMRKDLLGGPGAP